MRRITGDGARLVRHAALAALLAAVSISARADPEFALEQARLAAAQGDQNAAIAYLEQAVAEKPDFAIAHRWLGRLYARKGLLDKALDSAAAAVLLDPEPGDREHLVHLLAAGLPETLALRTPDAIPLAKTALVVAVPNVSKEGAASERRALILCRADAAPAHDPKSGAAFAHACYGYILDPEAARWRLALVVHDCAGRESEHETLALRCAALLLQAACVLQAHLAPALRAQMPLHLWLADDGEPGAETQGANIYLFRVGVARAPSEWVRQIIHECGHALLSGVNHFHEPEPWANGRLGEHLLSRWLISSRANPPHPWLEEADLGALAADADRCVAAFLGGGPASLLMADTSARGMDYYLGLANYVERAFGAGMLADAMRLTAGSTCRDFVIGVQQALERAAETGIELRATNSTGQDPLRHWLYLPAGAWRAACRGSAAVNFNGRLLGPEERDIGQLSAGWHSILLPPAAVVRFRRIS